MLRIVERSLLYVYCSKAWEESLIYYQPMGDEGIVNEI